MPRNTERYAYFNVGIPKGSETHLRLLAEARESGVPPVQVIALRLADYYSGHAAQSCTVPVTSDVGRDRENTPLSDLDQRAADAASAWLGDDEDE